MQKWLLENNGAELRKKIKVLTKYILTINICYSALFLQLLKC